MTRALQLSKYIGEMPTDEKWREFIDDLFEDELCDLGAINLDY